MTRALAMSSLFAFFGTASAAVMCGDVRQAYKNDQCCGQPTKVFSGLPECSICVVGCAPYTDAASGFPVWSKVVNEMADKCEVLIHVGDTKSGSTACNKSTMAGPIHMMKTAAASKGKMLLYTMGDNEVTDCHRGWYRTGKAGPPYIPSEYYNSEAARSMLVDEFNLKQKTDVTGKFYVDTQSDACPFHKYAEKCGMAIVTLEVAGSDWGLAGGGSTYPRMDEVDPISQRIAGYVRAKDCALSWLDQSVAKAKAAGLTSMLIAFQAEMFTVETTSGYYNWGKAIETASLIDGGNVTMVGPEGQYSAFLPLVKKLFELADANPTMMFRTVHADAHFWRVQKPWKDGTYASGRQNLEDVMVEGSVLPGLFGLTSYGKISQGPGTDPIDQTIVANVNVE